MGYSWWSIVPSLKLNFCGGGCCGDLSPRWSVFRTDQPPRITIVRPAFWQIPRSRIVAGGAAVSEVTASSKKGSCRVKSNMAVSSVLRGPFRVLYTVYRTELYRTTKNKRTALKAALVDPIRWSNHLLLKYRCRHQMTQPPREAYRTFALNLLAQ